MGDPPPAQNILSGRPPLLRKTPGMTGSPQRKLEDFVHPDRGGAFLSREVQAHLTHRGVATSKTTPYRPTGNSQVERYNGIIWNSVRLALKSGNLCEAEWECVLPDALHSIRSLLSTSTNETPHERFFNFSRKSYQGTSLPTWVMTPGPVFLRKFVRSSKSEPLVEEVELIESNPFCAHIRYPDGRELSVPLQDLAPCSGSITALQPSSYPALVEGEINESNNREGEPLSTVPVGGREIVSSDALPSLGAVGGGGSSPSFQLATPTSGAIWMVKFLVMSLHWNFLTF